MSRKKHETPEWQRVSVDARTAQRKVSAWLVRDVGNLSAAVEGRTQTG
jgi:hypothetical protein